MSQRLETARRYMDAAVCASSALKLHAALKADFSRLARHFIALAETEWRLSGSFRGADLAVLSMPVAICDHRVVRYGASLHANLFAAAAAVRAR